MAKITKLPTPGPNCPDVIEEFQNMAQEIHFEADGITAFAIVAVQDDGSIMRCVSCRQDYVALLGGLAQTQFELNYGVFNDDEEI